MPHNGFLLTLLLVTPASGQTYGPASWNRPAHPSGDSSLDSPADVALGDLDGDGDLDAVVANYNAWEVAVHLGRGLSGFEDAVRLPLGTKPTRIELADLDEDGALDLICLAEINSQVSLWFGDGAGGFGPGGVHTGSSTGWDLAVGDVDGDGHQDVAICQYSSVTIYEGDGQGHLAQPKIVAVAPSARALAVGEVTGDAVADVVVAHDNLITALASDGLGGYVSSTSPLPAGFGTTASVALGDCDADGFVDVAVASRDTDQVHVALGAGDGTFSGITTFLGRGLLRDIAAGDLDADGDEDLVLLSLSAGVELWRSAGDGTFAMSGAAAMGESPAGLALGDLDRDGGLDAAAACGEYDSTLVVVHGDGQAGTAGTFTAVGPEGAPGVATGDLNEDGWTDVVVAHRDADLVAYYAGLGGGALAPASPVMARGRPQDAAVADFDNDSHLDVAACFSSTSDVAVAIGDGQGGFTTQVVALLHAYPNRIEVGDLNGDQNADLVVAAGDEIQVLLGNGAGGFGPPATFSANGSAVWLALDDMDGDQDLDVVVTHYVDDRVSVLLGDGAGGFSLGSWVAASWPYQVDTGDLNGDGMADVVFVELDTAVFGLVVMLGTGGGALGARQEYLLGAVPRAVSVEDFDGDGHLDVVASTHLRWGHAFLRGDGTGQFVESGFSGGVRGWDAAVADMDLDGRPDRVSVSREEALVDVALFLHQPCGAVTYCEAKQNSQGCLPAIESDGTPSVTAGSGFSIRVRNVLNNNFGLLLYGFNGPAATPFAGGKLCLQPGTWRSPIRFSGGTPPPVTDCSGVLGLDFNAYIAGGTGAPGLSVVGTQVYGQWITRDPGFPPAMLGLSDALTFVLCP